MRHFLVRDELNPDGSRYIIGTSLAGWMKTDIDISGLQVAYSGYRHLIVDDDWDEFWFEDEEDESGTRPESRSRIGDFYK